MPVPDYQTFMLPLLELVNDQKEHALSEAYDTLTTQFGLTESERMDMLLSGRQSRFENRAC